MKALALAVAIVATAAHAADTWFSLGKDSKGIEWSMKLDSAMSGTRNDGVAYFAMLGKNADKDGNNIQIYWYSVSGKECAAGYGVLRVVPLGASLGTPGSQPWANGAQSVSSSIADTLCTLGFSKKST